MSTTVRGLTYRCPECGAVNCDDQLTFPNCYQCRENLFKCSYCHHFPGAGERCPFYPDRPLTRATVVPDCTQRDSCLLAGLRPLLMRPLSGLGPSVLISTLFGLIVAAAALFGNEGPRADSQGLQIEGFASRQSLRVGDGVSLRLSIVNPADAPSPPIELRIPDDHFGETFQFVDLRPMALAGISRGRGRYFQYDALPPHSAYEICVRLKALRHGPQQITAQILCKDDDIFRHHEMVMVEPALVANRRADHPPRVPDLEE